MSDMNKLISDNIDVWSSVIKKRNSTGRGSSKKFELTGIKKLRELILELAVQGKLVPQDPSDEPASELLERIEINKACLIKDKIIKKPKPINTEFEQPYSLPSNWVFVQLDAIAVFTGGFAFKSKQYISEGTRVIRISDFDERGLKNDKIVRYEYNDKLKDFLLEPNDLLMAMTGGTVGKSLLLEHLPEPLIVNQRVAGIRLLKGVNPKLIKYVLQTQGVQSVIKEAKNSTNDNISMGDIRNFLIPLPPENHQIALISKIDELMALCDQLEQKTEDSIDAHKFLVKELLSTLTNSKNTQDFEQNWGRISTHFDLIFTTEYSIEQLKQTIMQIAVMGKLVPQDSNDEPTSKLLKRITIEKEQLIKEKVIKKQKALSAISNDEKVFKVPKGWEWARIFNASLFTEYGTSEKAVDGVEGVPVLKMGDIQSGKVLHGGQKIVPPTIEDLPNLYLKYGDVLYNRTNSAELVGKTGMFEGEDDLYTFASYLIRIRCHFECVIPKYLTLSMNAPLFRKTQIDPYIKQQCGQANVNGTMMKNMVISIPPLAEQHRIVAKTEELLAICEQLKAGIFDAKTTQVHLAGAIVEQGLNQ